MNKKRIRDNLAGVKIALGMSEEQERRTAMWGLWGSLALPFTGLLLIFAIELFI